MDLHYGTERRNELGKFVQQQRTSPFKSFEPCSFNTKRLKATLKKAQCLSLVKFGAVLAEAKSRNAVVERDVSVSLQNYVISIGSQVLYTFFGVCVECLNQ
jgi:hypothetical protein